MKLDALTIGRCGELLVQLRLLKHDIESAPISTDRGIDLVVYSKRKQTAVTIQIKAKLKPAPAGGKGRPAIDWWIPHGCKADWIAFVELSREKIWLMTMAQVRRHQQGKHGSKHHICMLVGDNVIVKENAKTRPESEFSKYLFENQFSLL